MNEQHLFAFLASLGITVDTVEHEPAFTVDQLQVTTFPAPVCKNLFLKDRRKRLWLVIALTDTKINLKGLAKTLDAPELRFADVKLLKQHLGLAPGEVSLFGIINDQDKKVTVVIDTRIFLYERVGFHPLRNDATTFINTDDIKPFIEECSASYREINFYE